MRLGMAFQLIDDTLDYLADPDRLGKALGGDLRQGTITLPLIYLLQDEALGSERDILIEAIEKEQVTDEVLGTITDLMVRLDCGSKSIAKANGYAESSKKLLEGLPDAPLLPALRAAATVERDARPADS